MPFNGTMVENERSSAECLEIGGRAFLHEEFKDVFFKHFYSVLEQMNYEEKNDIKHCFSIVVFLHKVEYYRRDDNDDDNDDEDDKKEKEIKDVQVFVRDVNREKSLVYDYRTFINMNLHMRDYTVDLFLRKLDTSYLLSYLYQGYMFFEERRIRKIRITKCGDGIARPKLRDYKENKTEIDSCKNHFETRIREGCFAYRFEIKNLNMLGGLVMNISLASKVAPSSITHLLHDETDTNYMEVYPLQKSEYFILTVNENRVVYQFILDAYITHIVLNAIIETSIREAVKRIDPDRLPIDIIKINNSPLIRIGTVDGEELDSIEKYRVKISPFFMAD